MALEFEAVRDIAFDREESMLFAGPVDVVLAEAIKSALAAMLRLEVAGG